MRGKTGTGLPLVFGTRSASVSFWCLSQYLSVSVCLSLSLSLSPCLSLSLSVSASDCPSLHRSLPRAALRPTKETEYVSSSCQSSQSHTEIDSPYLHAQIAWPCSLSL
eukprot:COSAG03_NODE_20109_length_324_cov_0.955556_1_plen_107_part_11